MFSRFMEYDPSVTHGELSTPFGYVYLLRSSHGYKIGKSSSPKSRIASLRTASPFPLHVEAVIYAQYMDALEKALHERFYDKKIRGEWYALTEADVAFIIGLTSETIDEITREIRHEMV